MMDALTVNTLQRNGWMLLCAGALIMAGCREKAAVPSNYLARVGTAVISTNDYLAEASWRAEANRTAYSKEALLAELVTREALVEKAKQLGIDRDAEFVRSYKNLLVRRLKERELDPKVRTATVSDEEVRARYEADLGQYTRPGKVQLAILFVPVQPGSDEPQARARLTEAKKLAASLPKDAHGFGRLAVDYSEDQASRYKGGDIGWFDESQPRYRWPSEVVSAGFKLNDGDVSDVVATAKGLFLVKRLDSRAPAVTPLGDVADTIRRRLLVQKQQRLEKEFTQNVEQALGVTINPQILATLDKVPVMAKREEPLPPSLPR